MVKTSIAYNSKLCFLTLALLEPSHRYIYIYIYIYIYVCVCVCVCVCVYIYIYIQYSWSVLPMCRCFTADSGILHSTLFSAFVFVSAYSQFIRVLFIIRYFLLPRTFFSFTIPSRASFSRQFFLASGPDNFIFLFFISSSIIFPYSTISCTTSFYYFVSPFYTLHPSPYPHLKKCF